MNIYIYIYILYIYIYILYIILYSLVGIWYGMCASQYYIFACSSRQQTTTLRYVFHAIINILYVILGDRRQKFEKKVVKICGSFKNIYDILNIKNIYGIWHSEE